MNVCFHYIIILCELDFYSSRQSKKVGFTEAKGNQLVTMGLGWKLGQKRVDQRVDPGCAGGGLCFGDPLPNSVTIVNNNICVSKLLDGLTIHIK